jgi:hypothetical protein
MCALFDDLLELRRCFGQNTSHDAGIQRLYVAQDANYNVTALIGTDGYVKQRFQ